jgi:hypothetical protein
MPRPLFNPRKDPVPIVQEAGWALGPVWTAAENLSPTGIQSPDRPAHSQSLYRLRYPSHGNNLLRVSNSVVVVFAVLFYFVVLFCDSFIDGMILLSVVCVQ